ncbi:MAG: aminopeptidase P family protein [Bacteroidota bacterium]
MARLQAQLRTWEVDAVLIQHLPHIRWATGFTGSNALLVVQADAAHFFTDGRYNVQAPNEVEGAQVHIVSENLLSHLLTGPYLPDGARVLFQADHATVVEGSRMQAEGSDTLQWMAAGQVMDGLVMRKTPHEHQAIQAAQAVTDAVFTHLLDMLKPGLTEHEVAAEIVYQHLRRGAERMSFDPIVASGPRGALAHARPTDRRLEAGELVVIDMGCFVGGYASDMTRTIALGEPGEEARRVYSVVLDAQERALEATMAGIASNDLDQVARAVIEGAGYGPYFSHSLGHGVGLQIHEPPRVSFRSAEAIPEGAVITIEPGIYLPDRLGVRIEDLVVVERGGHRNLTASTKDLLVL